LQSVNVGERHSDLVGGMAPLGYGPVQSAMIWVIKLVRRKAVSKQKSIFAVIGKWTTHGIIV
jgi:hypothetical protein